MAISALENEIQKKLSHQEIAGNKQLQNLTNELLGLCAGICRSSEKNPRDHELPEVRQILEHTSRFLEHAINQTSPKTHEEERFLTLANQNSRNESGIAQLLASIKAFISSIQAKCYSGDDPYTQSWSKDFHIHQARKTIAPITKCLKQGAS